MNSNPQLPLQEARLRNYGVQQGYHSHHKEHAVRRTRTNTGITLAALASTTALLLTGCGGSEDDGGGDKKNGDKIEGAGSAEDKDKGEPSPGGSEAGDFQRPKIKLPSDLKLVFDFEKPSGTDESAAQGDAANYVRALMGGITEQTAKTKALGFYTVPLQGASEYAARIVKDHTKDGYTLTGTERFYRSKVRMAENGKYATITFCANQAELYGKVIKTGKVLRTKESANSYLFYSIDLQKAADPKGLWKAHSIEVEGKATQCRD